jgi:uncharacterized protein
MIVTKEFNIAGMQCSGCETIIEEVVNQVDGVIFIKADYLKATMKVSFDTDKTGLAIIQEACSSRGYTLKRTSNPKKQKNLKIALSVLAFMILIIIILLAREFGHQLKLPEVNSQTSDAMIFVVGLLTGLHCVGMCGSFMIGYTAKDARQGRSIYRSHILYGTGKTLSYAMFGCFFGLIGSVFRISPFVSGLSIGIAGIFLILYGLNMLDISSALKIVRIIQPTRITHYLTEKRRQSRSPFFIGFFSGFILGCGPLQVMYLMAAGNGSAIEGAKILALFGLGTLPILLGFGLLTRVLSNTMTHRFVQASGIILVVLGSMMLNKGLIRTRTGSDLKSVHPCCQEQVDPK